MTFLSKKSINNRFKQPCLDLDYNFNPTPYTNPKSNPYYVRLANFFEFGLETEKIILRFKEPWDYPGGLPTTGLHEWNQKWQLICKHRDVWVSELGSRFSPLWPWWLHWWVLEVKGKVVVALWLCFSFKVHVTYSDEHICISVGTRHYHIMSTHA